MDRHQAACYRRRIWILDKIIGHFDKMCAQIHEYEFVTLEGGGGFMGAYVERLEKIKGDFEADREELQRELDR